MSSDGPFAATLVRPLWSLRLHSDAGVHEASREEQGRGCPSLFHEFFERQSGSQTHPAYSRLFRVEPARLGTAIPATREGGLPLPAPLLTFALRHGRRKLMFKDRQPIFEQIEPLLVAFAIVMVGVFIWIA
jgi:hypothetical protein